MAQVMGFPTGLPISRIDAKYLFASTYVSAPYILLDYSLPGAETAIQMGSAPDLGGFIYNYSDTVWEYYYYAIPGGWTSTPFKVNEILLMDNKKLYLGDSSDAEIYFNGTNLVISDPVAGSLTLSELSCPPYIYIKAVTQSEGNLNLSDATNWNKDKALIKAIKVVTSSTDWDLVLYPDDDFDEAGTFPSITLVDAGNGSTVIYLDLPYYDTDASKEIHLKYTDNSGANTADIYIWGYALR